MFTQLVLQFSTLPKSWRMVTDVGGRIGPLTTLKLRQHSEKAGLEAFHEVITMKSPAVTLI